MKPNKPFSALAILLLAIALFAIFRPKPEPTSFESGYGLKFVGQRVSWNGPNRLVQRFFVSDDALPVVAARIEPVLGRPRLAGDGMRIYSTFEGTVTAFDRNRLPGDVGPEVEGAKCVLDTKRIAGPNLLQKAALAIGIRL